MTYLPTWQLVAKVHACPTRDPERYFCSEVDSRTQAPSGACGYTVGIVRKAFARSIGARPGKITSELLPRLKPRLRTTVVDQRPNHEDSGFKRVLTPRGGS